MTGTPADDGWLVVRRKTCHDTRQSVSDLLKVRPPVGISRPAPFLAFHRSSTEALVAKCRVQQQLIGGRFRRQASLSARHHSDGRYLTCHVCVTKQFVTRSPVAQERITHLNVARVPGARIPFVLSLPSPPPSRGRVRSCLTRRNAPMIK